MARWVLSDDPDQWALWLQAIGTVSASLLALAAAFYAGRQARAAWAATEILREQEARRRVKERDSELAHYLRARNVVYDVLSALEVLIRHDARGAKAFAAEMAAAPHALEFEWANEEFVETVRAARTDRALHRSLSEAHQRLRNIDRAFVELRKSPNVSDGHAEAFDRAMGQAKAARHHLGKALEEIAEKMKSADDFYGVE